MSERLDSSYFERLIAESIQSEQIRRQQAQVTEQQQQQAETPPAVVVSDPSLPNSTEVAP